MARVQIPISFSYQGSYYVATSNAGSPTTQIAIQLPAAGSTVTVINRVTNQPAIVYSSATGTSTISPVITDSGGNVPGWVPEGSYTLSAAASGSFAGATINWEAVYGAGVSNVAATVAGDLSGSLPNPTVNTVGGHTPVTNATAAGGDLSGIYPNPTISTRLRPVNVTATSYTANAWDLAIINTPGSTITLPPTPADGDQVAINAYQTPAVPSTINGSGRIIWHNGTAATTQKMYSKTNWVLIYTSATNTWRVIAEQGSGFVPPARAYNNTGVVLNGGHTSADWTWVPVTTIVYDDAGAFSGGNYYAPVTGIYHVSGNVIIFGVGGREELSFSTGVWLNGSFGSPGGLQGNEQTMADATGYVEMVVSGDVQLNAGNFATLAVACNQAQLYQTSPPGFANYLCVHQVG